MTPHVYCYRRRRRNRSCRCTGTTGPRPARRTITTCIFIQLPNAPPLGCPSRNRAILQNGGSGQTPQEFIQYTTTAGRDDRAVRPTRRRMRSLWFALPGRRRPTICRSSPRRRPAASCVLQRRRAQSRFSRRFAERAVRRRHRREERARRIRRNLSARKARSSQRRRLADESESAHRHEPQTGSGQFRRRHHVSSAFPEFLRHIGIHTARRRHGRAVHAEIRRADHGDESDQQHHHAAAHDRHHRRERSRHRRQGLSVRLRPAEIRSRKPASPSCSSRPTPSRARR